METTTFVAGSRVDDVMTLFVIDRAMTGAIFGTYIERGLVPTPGVRRHPLIDKLPAYRVVGVRE
jgi:hypothetical protein